VCTTENTTESRSSITNKFETLWESEIHINLKIDYDALNRRRRPFCLGEQYIIYTKDSDGNVLASAYASMPYTMWRIKSETETYATDNTSSGLNVTSRNPNWPISTKTQYLYRSIVECFL
jgi:hypothetical protein